MDPVTSPRPALGTAGSAIAASVRSSARAALGSAASVWLLAILGLGLAVRVIGFMASPTLVYPDTSVYTTIIGAQPFTNPVWWAGTRPGVVPLAYRLVGDSVPAVIVLQLVLAIVCWSVLALVVFRLTRTAWLKPVAAGLVLAFSLAREIAEWDRVVLSESISVSLLALVVAAGLLYVHRPGGRRLAALLVLAALWVFTRDSNAYDVLLLAPVLAAAAIVQRPRWRLHAVAAAGCLAIFVASYASADAGQRWLFPFYNLMGLRFLKDPSTVQYFERHGMPMSPAVAARTGKAAGSDNFAVYRDPDLQQLRDWVLADGQRTYVEFLATHPDAAIRTPGSQVVVLLSELDGIRAYAPRAWTPFAGTKIAYLPSAWLFPDRDAPGLLLASALGFAAATALAVGWRRTWLVPALLVATAVATAFVIYHADAGDIARHELMPAIQVRLGLWLFLLFAADVIAIARRAPAAAAPVAAEGTA